jgi:SAM-dependent methyltransferase
MTRRDKADQWSPASYAANARFVSDLGEPVVDWLAPEPGERILDVGCGDGALSQRIAERGASVLGVDASSSMVAAAREAGLNARVLDGEALTFEGEFDGVFSNAALHWMTDPAAVMAGIRKALRPAGRFVGELGAAGNVITVTNAIAATLAERGMERPQAWFFPTPAQWCTRLEANGFIVERLHRFPRPTPVPNGLEGWLRTFGHDCFEQVPPEQREAVIAEVMDRARPALCDADGNWTLDYVRLRFAARLA